ncbi:MAG: hypothetical protein IJB11_00300, partial [Oscillospiraceae bacterium]|nr:hypothetical protein [Oscillospiraceae bacterium]
MIIGIVSALHPVHQSSIVSHGSSAFAGGIYGYTGGVVADFTNCYNAASIACPGSEGAIIGKYGTNGTSQKITFNNIYFRDSDGLSFSGGGGTDYHVLGNNAAMTDAQFASGEVAYLLGDAFGQNIDNSNPTEAYPVISDATVYRVSNCNGSSFYSNMESSVQHQYEAVIIKPTCTIGGYTLYTCIVCGNSYVADEVDALGHSFGEGVITSQPTCIEDGVKTFTCSCGDSYTEIVPANGHDYTAIVTAPTCTEAGHTTYTCSVCGDSYVGNQVSATGHSHVGKTVAPTCTAEGYTTYTCSACGDSYVADQVAALGHSYVNGYCSVCGE